jgi:hypothetical protein
VCWRSRFAFLFCAPTHTHARALTQPALLYSLSNNIFQLQQNGASAIKAAFIYVISADAKENIIIYHEQRDSCFFTFTQAAFSIQRVYDATTT